MNEQILDLLQSKNLIDAKARAIAEDLVTRGKTLEQALVGGKYVSEVDFTKAQAESLGIAYEDLTDFVIDPDVVSLLPKQTLDTFQVLPLRFDGKVSGSLQYLIIIHEHQGLQWRIG